MTKIAEKNIKKTEYVLKKQSSIGLAELLKKTGINYYSMQNILKYLELYDKIIIAKVQTIKGEKIITQSMEIKWIGV